ncbi:MAG: HAMP domain-containing histidine kinase [Cyclobacteriaceae bacterium]|nr:HAMP domain-containing histidine kinase [Cyclobacteriaceae bacterium]
MQLLTKFKTELFAFVGILALTGAGVWLLSYPGNHSNTEKVVSAISANLNQHVEHLDDLNRVWQEQWSNGPVVELTPVGLTDFCILADQEFIQWTGNRFLPPVRFAQADFSVRHLRTSAGDFIIKKWEWTERASLLAITPLYVHYPIQNEYLQPWWNESVFGNHPVTLYDPNAPTGEAVSVDAQALFRISVSDEPGMNSASRRAGVFMVLFAMILFVALLIQIHIRVFKKSAGGLLLIACGLVLLRAVMIVLKFPAGFIGSGVFDAKFFASSELNPSLGDLVLNSITVTALCFLVMLYMQRMKRRLLYLSETGIHLPMLIFASLAILFGGLFPFIVIQTIYNNSAITLNISESIAFDLLRVLSFLSVILSWISAFVFIQVFVRLLMVEKRTLRIVIAAGIGLLLFVLINEATGQGYLYTLLLTVLYVGVIIYFKLYQSLKPFRYHTFTYFFVGLIFFSVSGLIALHHFNVNEKVEQQFRFANSFLIERDDFGEFLLAEAREKIAADFFIQSRLSGPFINKETVRQKVRQVFIPGYFNKYNISIQLYGATGESLDEQQPQNFSTLLSTFDSEVSRTSFEGIYFVNRQDNESARKYIVVIPVKRNELSAGYIVLELLLKRVIPNSVYPELLVDNRFQQVFRAQDFSYAIWSNDEMQAQSGEFNYRSGFASILEEQALYRQGMVQSGFLHTASKDASGRIVVISSATFPFIYQVADFSFLIVLGLFVLFILLLIIGLADYLRQERPLLSTRIQLILNLAFFIPLIAVSVITLGLTARSNQQQMGNEYEMKSQNFSMEISNHSLESDGGGEVPGEQNFIQLAKLAGLDANLFTAEGHLLFTTQPLVFENQLLTPYINPVALRRIKQGERVFTMDEQVGLLQYFVAYSALYSPKDGSLTGVIAIPFYQSAYLLERMQINVLANILSIFTAVFAVLVIISYWVSQWLTFPLRMITQKLRRISLTQSNQPMEWLSDDEIGIMVREYNLMLASLSDSKRELERNQRERAWREIAQQVAHEIKNPLTPMKLMLQQAERIQDSDPQKAEKIKRTIASLLSQVDTLDGIASSFSAFAKMPEPVMQQVELVALIKNAMRLHESNVSVHLSTDVDAVYVQGDEQLLGRILSNIILNSMQAARADEPLAVQISVQRTVDVVKISIADNGTGIDEQLRDKIFLPHFSTKKSGSGLGLAIARQGIEQMGGRIWFKSTIGEGSVFCIEMPVVNE